MTIQIQSDLTIMSLLHWLPVDTVNIMHRNIIHTNYYIVYEMIVWKSGSLNLVQP
jgi:hypothetical protein